MEGPEYHQLPADNRLDIREWSGMLRLDRGAGFLLRIKFEQFEFQQFEFEQFEFEQFEFFGYRAGSAELPRYCILQRQLHE